MESKPKAIIMDEAAMKRAVTRIAHEVIERNEGSENVALVGIVRRGVPLANLLADEVEKIEGGKPPIGTLDISFYRDDVNRAIAPVLHATDIPFDINGKDIVLVDDFLYTGRTLGPRRTHGLRSSQDRPACRHGRPRPPRAAHSRRLRW